ncbi:hypothetical protein L8C07_25885 [Paenibacillus sp. CMAA1739]|nr:hypothetical protein [Paenibacillus sp. CMAA1739]
MDKQDSTVRQILAQKAELIGMVRLPNTAFQSLAGAFRPQGNLQIGVD